MFTQGRGIKSNARTNRGTTTKVYFDQTEIVKVVSVADGGKLKVLKREGRKPGVFMNP
jgi:hypothetical protein